jgi:DNA gyrase subunit A
MDHVAKNIIPIRIEDEMKNSYMDYSMSVIIGRALPDVRDGLKPVHRRILYAMYREGNLHNKKYSKCAGVVGEVLKKYHPHGDSAVYDALVRMAQPWNLRNMLVDGQGNFGSVDGDPAAAYRYTECKMTKLAEELLADIDKETVSFSANFDGEHEEPDVLPAQFPNLLVNGADGIAVGMATKIPPHNLREIVNACIAVIQNPELTLDELIEIVPGPDFPTAGTIYGRSGIRSAYETGRGRIVVRGQADFETLSNGRTAIVITEIPFQVNKARLIQQVADLVKDKRLEGIHALRDESDRQGMRVVIELKYDVFEEVVLNHLYKSTSLQMTFGANMLAIVNNQPRVLSLKEMIQHYVAHRREVVVRRTRYNLRKAEERAHILEGYRKALDHLDEVIALIRASHSTAEARTGLMENFAFTEVQAQAILELQLQRLTGMQRLKIDEEYNELQEKITYFRGVLADENVLMGVVTDELILVRDAYSDERRTRIVDARAELTIHDLVAEEDHVVTLSHLGYIKRCSPDEWQMQRRGGMGKKGMNTRNEDFVTSLFIANTHDILLVFTTSGKVYPLPVYQVPESGRGAKGRPIINLVPVDGDENIAAVVSVREIDTDEVSLMFVSRQGIIKRTVMQAYKNLRTGGMIACGVADGDELMRVRVVPHAEEVDVMLLSKGGLCIRFPWTEVPEYGRSARGNRGMRLRKGDVVVDAVTIPGSGLSLDEEEIEIEETSSEETSSEDGASDTTDLSAGDMALLTVTALGYGKRTSYEQYRSQRRNGKGLLSFRTSDATGEVVGALKASSDHQIMLVTDTGRVIRIGVGGVRVQGRVTKGVRLMRLHKDERIVDMAKLLEDEEESSEE